MGLRDIRTVEERKAFIETEKHVNLSSVKKALIDEESAIHCENLIGAISLPLGIAGPLKISGAAINSNFYIPLATTEGALVASVSRGAKAVTEAAGAHVMSYRVGTTRGPVFEVRSLEENKKLREWLLNNEKRLAEIAASTSSHVSLTNMKINGVADKVFVRFYFNTRDAMGMNMVTIASDKLIETIVKETGAHCISIAGNFDIDKKPAWLNFIDNRGFAVWGEVIVGAEIVKNVLKTTPKALFDVWLSKCMIGSAMSGSLGFNSHYANIVAAFFAATGQDLAHVVEGSMGITTAKITESGDLYFSVYLPAVMLGTVGGGTHLSTQKEARSILGVTHSEELAEVLGGAVLAGELSLLASLAEGSLAKAHEKLGR